VNESDVVASHLLLVGLSVAINPQVRAQEPVSVPAAIDCEIKPLYWTEQVHILREKDPSVRWCGDDEDAVLETQQKERLAKSKTLNLNGFRLGGCVGWELACFLGQIRLGYSNERYGWLVTLPFLDVEIIKYFNEYRNPYNSSAYKRSFVSVDYSAVCGIIMGGEEFYWHLACFEPGVGIEIRPKKLGRLVFRPRVSVGFLMFDQEFGLPLPTGSLSILWAP
jgi:hypothetical protein